MATNNVPIIPEAVMLDRFLGEIQQALVDNLSWLDVAFGKAQRLVKMQSGKRIVYPSVYCGGWNGHGENDYIEVSPDSHIGNFSFFDIEDPQVLSTEIWARAIRVPVGLVVWFNLEKVYGERNNRNTEYLKAQILDIVNGHIGWTMKGGRVEINRCYERAENIYRGYTLSEIDNQFLMHPYGGFRFDGTLQFDELCLS